MYSHKLLPIDSYSCNSIKISDDYTKVGLRLKFKYHRVSQSVYSAVIDETVSITVLQIYLSSTMLLFFCCYVHIYIENEAFFLVKNRKSLFSCMVIRIQHHFRRKRQHKIKKKIEHNFPSPLRILRLLLGIIDQITNRHSSAVGFK